MYVQGPDLLHMRVMPTLATQHAAINSWVVLEL